MGQDLFGVDMEKFESVFEEVASKYSVDFYKSCLLGLISGQNVGDPKISSYYMALAASLVLYIEREHGGDDKIAADLLKNINLPDLGGE